MAATAPESAAKRPGQRPLRVAATDSSAAAALASAADAMLDAMSDGSDDDSDVAAADAADVVAGPHVSAADQDAVQDGLYNAAYFDSDDETAADGTAAAFGGATGWSGLLIAAATDNVLAT